MNFSNGLLTLVLCLSSGFITAQSHHSQWKKVYERDLTDFQLSAEGAEVVLFVKSQGLCRMDVNFYGETGQSKYQYKLTRGRLTVGSYREYHYESTPLSEVNKNKIKLVQNKKLDPNSNIIKRDFVDIYQNIPKKVLRKYCF